MYTTHEGEILLKEKYGSKTFQRYYVKPAEQWNITVIDDTKSFKALSWLETIFLPQGYPDSVSRDYLAYQIWDTAQAFCSTITGILATQEVLRGVGVGDTDATPLAATITWVLKDACGHLGRIVFAYTHGTYLDAYSKKWRLYADTLNDAAMCVEMALPMFKNYTTFGLCVSTVMKAIVGVAGGATRVAMTQHHAIRGNMADVSAKDSAQETAVNFVASFVALTILSVFGNSVFLFLTMMAFHITFNYLAVRAICLRTLNETRFIQVIDTYLRREIISNPCEVNKVEPLIYYQFGPHQFDYMLCGFHIKLGHSVKSFIARKPNATYLRSINEVYSERNYMLLPNTFNRSMYIVFKTQASPDDILCAYFHAIILSAIICAINRVQLAVYHVPNGQEPRPFAAMCQTLPHCPWSRTVAEGSSNGLGFEPSIQLMKYVDDIVEKEWRNVVPLLKKTGWDLSKHLLVVDEWRVCSPKVKTVNYDLIEDVKQTVLRATSNFNSIQNPFAGAAKSVDEKEELGIDTFTVEPEETPESPKSSSQITSKGKKES